MVNTSQKHPIAFLKQNVPNISKVYYFSHRASAQYKNKKNFINVCHHNTDFRIHAEWHSFGTSYGEGSCDSVAGTTKGLAACSSLLHHQILTPAQLHSWAKEYFPSIYVQYVCKS
jgi:hypothetical protein